MNSSQPNKNNTTAPPFFEVTAAFIFATAFEKASPISIAFEKAVKQARMKKGITQFILGDGCGLERSYISQIEGGRRKPSLPVLWNIAINLEINIVTLMAAAI